MNPAMIGIICGIGAGLAVTELSALASVAARKIVMWSARRTYSHDPGAAEEHAEDWAAGIEGQTSNLAKLGTALTFFLPALPAATRTTFKRLRRKRPPLVIDMPPPKVRSTRGVPEDASDGPLETNIWDSRLGGEDPWL